MTVQRGNSDRSNVATKSRISLLLSTAMVAASAATAHAGTVNIPAPVAPATSTSVDTVNSQINTLINTPDSVVTLTIDPAAIILPGAQSYITFTPSSGKGDGAISVTNAGKIGSIDAAGNVTSFAGISMSGVSPAAATNTFTLSNSGLVTGGIFASGFGGPIKIDNSGTVYSGLNASGSGDVSLNTTSAGAVRSGSISAVSSSSKFDPVTGTTTYTSGNVSVTQDGPAVSVDGLTKVGIFADAAAGNTTVSVNAVAGNVTANAGGDVSQQFLSTPAAAGKSVTTYISANKIGGGTATVQIGSSGDVGSVSASGAAGSTVTVDGKVTGNAVSNSAFNESNYNQTVTQDSSGNTTKFVISNTSQDVGGTTAIAVNQGGSVSGSVNATTSGSGGAGVTIAGAVQGSANATATGTKSTSLDTYNYNPAAPADQNYTNVSTSSAIGGAASISVSAGGSALGGVHVNADGGAKIDNAGVIGPVGFPGGYVTATSSRNLNLSQNNAYQETHTTSATGGVDTYVTSDASQSGTVGGTVTVNNATGGVINSNIYAYGLGDVTVSNDGIVLGTTYAQSTGSLSNYTSNTKEVDTTVLGTSPSPDVTTTVYSETDKSDTTSTGGSVTGTYAFANGDASFGTASGDVFQYADKASSVTVSGSLIGSVYSNAGLGTTSSSTTDISSTEVLDTLGAGSKQRDETDTYSQSTNVGGVGSVAISGNVTGSVASNATEASTVSVTGTIGGGVTSSAGGNSSYASTDISTGKGTITGYNLVLDTGEEKGSSSSTVTAGDSSVAIASPDGSTPANVGGSVYVYGVKSASAAVDSLSKVGGSVSVTTGGTDSTTSYDHIYARDAKTGIVTASYTDQSSSQSAVASGAASADIAGTVNGGVSVNANRGDATANITGIVGGYISTTSNGSSSTSSSTYEYLGKAPGFTPPGSPILPAPTKVTVSNSTTNLGGMATVTVDTDPALQAQGLTGVGGGVTANGIAGATVTVTAGSKVAGSVGAFSTGYDSTSGSVTNYAGGVATDSTSTYSLTFVGGVATITNGGETGGAYAGGATGALVANTGKISGPVSAISLGVNSDSTTVDTALNIAAQHKQVMTTIFTPVGGDAKVTNAAGGLILGSVDVEGATGEVTNDGAIAGTIHLGGYVNNYTSTVTRTVVANGPAVVTAPTTLFDQTYTVDQNGTSGGVSVYGAQVTGPDGKLIQTSNIAATVNLNNGSATLGSIDAERDSKTDAFLTNTTVNLNGSGFLGADEVFVSAADQAKYATLTPSLVLSKDAQGAGVGSYGYGVNVLGVTSLNKTGAGTFVIVGNPYQPAAASALQPSWTMDVGSFNVQAGEVQLGVLDPSNDTFGIKGTVNVANGATLVLGRRTVSPVNGPLNGLIGSGQDVQATKVYLQGDYNQTSKGTTVAVVAPSLVRYGSITAPTSGTAPELLGPIAGGLNIPYFTAGSTSSSSVDVNGNVNLAGTVLLDLSKNMLFANGDNSTLFTYTGTGTVDPAATVATTLSSPFVKFSLTNDATNHAIKLTVNRASYATAATNPNAASAAKGLDSALASAITAIKLDAAGGNAFSSVQAFGNAQDIANIASGLDWRLNMTQAAQVFDELSSGEFYGSLSSVEQNVGFTSAAERLTMARSDDAPAGASLWLSPMGNFAKYGGGSSGASKIKVDSYGGAFGLDMGYGNGGAFGFGFGYAQHDASARGSAESGRATTYTIGAYWTQRFQQLYANAQFSYGFSKFETTRELAILARTITADFKGNEWDGRVQVGYDFATGGLIVTPYGELALRHWSMDSFNEKGGAGIGLHVDAASKTVFNPTIGVKLAIDAADVGAFKLKPYGKLSYTFQGSTGNSRTVNYLGGGNSFTLDGVDPNGYGKIEAGLDATMNDKIGIFLGVGYGFGGDQDVGRVQGGINISL